MHAGFVSNIIQVNVPNTHFNLCGQFLLAMRVLCLVVIAIMAITDGVLSANPPPHCPRKDPEFAVHLPHEHDCTKFYKCSHGVPYLMDCPYRDQEHVRRLYFNPKLQVCDWPENVNCTSDEPICTPVSDDITLKPYNANCSMYYLCVEGGKDVKKCDDGFLFDKTLLMCVPAEEADCTNWDECPPPGSSEIVHFPHECYCNLYYKCVNGEKIRRKCEHNKIFDYIQKKCLPKHQAKCKPHLNCPKNGTKFIAHMTNCSQYYKCVNGMKSKQSCRPKMLFDVVTGVCTWYTNAKCYSESKLPPQPDLDEDIEIFKCPANTNRLVKIPHECSCNKFYRCEKGEAELKNCPENKLYDYLLQMCVDGPDVKCRPDCIPNPSPITPTPTPTTPTPTPTTPTPTPTTPTPTPTTPTPTPTTPTPTPTTPTPTPTPTTPTPTTPTTIPTPIPICPNTTCGGIIRYPVKGRCDKYYECIDGSRSEQVCDAGLYFDPEKQNCGTKQNVFCDDRDCPSEGSGKKVRHECQCNVYYLCENGKKVHEDCLDGLLFDFLNQNCSANVTDCPSAHHFDRCIGTCPEYDSAGDSEYTDLPHEECTKFCRCNNGELDVLDCPDGMHFSKQANYCMIQETAECDVTKLDKSSIWSRIPYLGKYFL